VSAGLFDVAVIGAGPAGLAAAASAAGAGLRVAVVDAGERPGGQFWRHAEGDEGERHHGWATFVRLRAELRGVTYLLGHQVWTVVADDGASPPGGVPECGRPGVRGRNPRFTLHLTGGKTRSLAARAVILCPGGYDRQLPVPGWTLPGVMAAGGAQALLKGHHTLAGRRVVVAGTGPFLLPVATGLAAAGARVAAVCEAGSPARWLRHPLAASATPGKALEAAGYAAALLRHRVPYLPRTVVARVHGTDEVSGVTLARVDAAGRLLPEGERRLEADLVALGWGFTPSLELVLAVGAETRLGADGSLVAAVDRARRSSVPGVYVAGEATGVGGAAKAVAEGELAGLTAAVDLGRVPSAAGRRRARRLAGRVARAEAFATAMHRAHPVPERWSQWLTPDTVLCRCEEVRVGEVDAAREELGAGDPRTAKLLARPGMGLCQGRVCGFATAALLAARDGGRAVRREDLHPLEQRPLAVPVPLGELAELAEPDSPTS
jgi:D-hydroxyproline dehydrogenase subunit alpha